MTSTQKIITTIVSLLGFPQAVIKIESQKEALEINIDIPKEEAGILIGHHGEKIDSLQLIFSLIHNQNNDQFQPVHLDIANYRQRRQVALEELADHAVEQSQSSGQEIILPPLPSHERRLIHLYLETKPNITTYSEGQEPHRRIVVGPSSQS